MAWRRWCGSGSLDTLRQGMAAAGMAAAGGAAVKVGTLLTGKQIVAGILVSAMAGAGVYAAAGRAVDTPDEPRAPAALIASTRGVRAGTGGACAGTRRRR